jgi:prepilin-type N-terminal cleavage/methylation domain-containing protein
MKSRKGFTLIELMVVILIVGILAAVAIPLMRGRIDSAKWSEGKSIMGTIATAIRAYAAEKGTDTVSGDESAVTMTMLGFNTTDFDGTYFHAADFTWDIAYDATAAIPLQFTIECIADANSGISSPPSWTLNHLGTWNEGT